MTHIDAGDVRLPARLDLPSGTVRAGLIPLHGAEAAQRSHFLYEHLARVLPERGVAVLRYDRRPGVDDIPLEVQAADARAAIRTLREHVGDAPVALWGWSQGGWAAPLAAATYPEEVAALVVVSSCGISPAAQMRYGTAEQLRRHGYGPNDLRELLTLRLQVEAYLRGDRDRAEVQAAVDEAARRPWFPLVYIRRQLPEPGAWRDMDFEPAPMFARVRCPVLAFYGETDDWMPIEDSAAAWERVGGTVVRLPGCGHAPTLDERQDIDGISAAYTAALLAWLGDTLPKRVGSHEL